VSRLFASAALLALLGAGVAPSLAEEPASAPVADDVWDAHDGEGRWVLLRTAPDRFTGPLGSRWVPYLVRRGEWDLLEWVVLATANSQAIEALEKAGRPTWVRAAVWALGSRESHALDSAALRLKTHAPLVRAWFARHAKTQAQLPPPARTFAEHLAAEGGAVDEAGAAALAAPYNPVVLLAALLPPREVVPFGDRLRAQPGVTYLHQVERALDMLGESGFVGSPWLDHLGALLAHPVPAVRRAAALACVPRRGDIPAEALLARLESPAESADVRSAALLGLSLSPDPAVRARILVIGSDPLHPAFTAAVSRLADVDDGFAIMLWNDLDASAAGPTVQAFLQAERRRLSARIAAQKGDSLGQRIPDMLALAAHVEMTAHPLEGRLLPWTLHTIGAALAAPEVRAALETLAADPPPEERATPSEAARAERVRLHARALLAKPPAPTRAR
jgi:hypothetical protein